MSAEKFFNAKTMYSGLTGFGINLLCIMLISLVPWFGGNILALKWFAFIASLFIVGSCSERDGLSWSKFAIIVVFNTAVIFVNATGLNAVLTSSILNNRNEAERMHIPNPNTITPGINPLQRDSIEKLSMQLKALQKDNDYKNWQKYRMLLSYICFIFLLYIFLMICATWNMVRKRKRG